MSNRQRPMLKTTAKDECQNEGEEESANQDECRRWNDRRASGLADRQAVRVCCGLGAVGERLTPGEDRVAADTGHLHHSREVLRRLLETRKNAAQLFQPADVRCKFTLR